MISTLRDITNNMIRSDKERLCNVFFTKVTYDRKAMFHNPVVNSSNALDPLGGELAWFLNRDERANLRMAHKAFNPTAYTKRAECLEAISKLGRDTWKADYLIFNRAGQLGRMRILPPNVELINDDNYDRNEEFDNWKNDLYQVYALTFMEHMIRSGTGLPSLLDVLTWIKNTNGMSQCNPFTFLMSNGYWEIVDRCLTSIEKAGSEMQQSNFIARQNFIISHFRLTKVVALGTHLRDYSWTLGNYDDSLPFPLHSYFAPSTGKEQFDKMWSLVSFPTNEENNDNKGIELWEILLSGISDIEYPFKDKYHEWLMQFAISLQNPFSGPFIRCPSVTVDRERGKKPVEDVEGNLIFDFDQELDTVGSPIEAELRDFEIFYVHLGTRQVLRTNIAIDFHYKEFMADDKDILIELFDRFKMNITSRIHQVSGGWWVNNLLIVLPHLSTLMLEFKYKKRLKALRAFDRRFFKIYLKKDVTVYDLFEKWVQTYVTYHSRNVANLPLLFEEFLKRLGRGGNGVDSGMVVDSLWYIGVMMEEGDVKDLTKLFQDPVKFVKDERGKHQKHAAFRQRLKSPRRSRPATPQNKTEQ
eukprot:GILJ01013311.1.p1 GENE.GILJ01013311.1~~GILJ01013311.1.p1  ORF type:complete len:585 (-),score=31.36 GILJ01013311.1:25-1779(-)